MLLKIFYQVNYKIKNDKNKQTFQSFSHSNELQLSTSPRLSPFWCKSFDLTRSELGNMSSTRSFSQALYKTIQFESLTSVRFQSSSCSRVCIYEQGYQQQYHVIFNRNSLITQELCEAEQNNRVSYCVVMKSKHYIIKQKHEEKDHVSSLLDCFSSNEFHQPGAASNQGVSNHFFLAQESKLLLLIYLENHLHLPGFSKNMIIIINEANRR